MMKPKIVLIRITLVQLLVLTSFILSAQDTGSAGNLPATMRGYRNREYISNGLNSVCNLTPNSTIDAIPSGNDSLSLIISSDATRIDSIRIVYHNVCGMSRMAAGFRITPGVLIDPAACTAQWQSTCIRNILYGHQFSIDFNGLTASATLKSISNCSACAAIQFTLPTITAIYEPEGNYTDKPELGQNYPNPFSTGTIIEFSLPNSEFVTLNIFNASGKQVISLLSQIMPEGRHKIEWIAAGMAEGVYFYQLKSGPFILTRKLLLIR